MTLISYFLTAMALFVALPVTLLLIEVVAAMALPARDVFVAPGNRGRQRVAVLVPAHNESSGLLPTLADIKPQLGPADCLLVVADNCTDDTAAVAAKAGAEVAVRHDPQRSGKGFALAYGLDYLSAESPEIVIVIDADCRVAENTIDRLANLCAATNRPVQALDLMLAPPGSSVTLKVAEFAWRVKNWVRPLGLKSLGLPCQLMGTGMALPWALIRSANLGHGSIVEDLKLGHDMTLEGFAPVFCPEAKVTSVFPLSTVGAQSQRLRWEQGHIGLIAKCFPGLLHKAVVRTNIGLLALALDLAVPPLSLLTLLLILMFLISGAATTLGFGGVTTVISAFSMAAFGLAILLSWLKVGREILPLGAIWSVVRYVVGKLPLYANIFSRRPVPQWVRTDRAK